LTSIDDVRECNPAFAARVYAGLERAGNAGDIRNELTNTEGATMVTESYRHRWHGPMRSTSRFIIRNASRPIPRG